MMRILLVFVGLCFVLNSVVGCGHATKETAPAGQGSQAATLQDTTTESGEPAYITVQHCLIGFRGSVGDKPISRSKEEAQRLAEELLQKARDGENFDEIIAMHTDDSPPGIYQMANFASESNMSGGDPSEMIFARSNMVAAFGDVGFPLQVGDFGMAAYDPQRSPFGWHIIKRIK